MPNTKPLVFISYIHEEEYLASALQEKLAAILLGGVEFFAAGLPSGISPGEKWLERIEGELQSAGAMIVLCSPGSVTRPWINFETGAAWACHMLGHCSNVIPLCHTGLSPRQLEEPLRALHGLDLTVERDIQSLVSQMAKLAGLNIPKFDPRAFIASLPPSGDQLELQQLKLRETLELTSRTLRGQVPGEDIQVIIGAIVKTWSRAVYNRDKPPEPVGLPPFPREMSFPCRLCDVDHMPSNRGCCSQCGLFCSDWVRHTGTMEST